MPDARGGRWASLLQLTLFRLREFFREPEALFWVFAFPVLLAAGLGIAFRTQSTTLVRVGLRTDVPAAGGFAQALSRGGIDLVLVDSAAAARALQTGDVLLVVTPLTEHVVEFTYDINRPDALVARYLTNDVVQRLGGRAPDPITVQDRRITAIGGRYIDFLIPGLIGMNLMTSGIWAVGYAVVDQRRRKLLKRFVATPMSRADYLLSFLFSQVVLLVLQVGLLLAFGMLAFDVPLRGSPGAFAAVAGISALTFGAIGVLIAARPQTTEGASGLMNVIMLPMWIFGGVFFGIGHYPESMQPALRLLPLTAANDALRAVALDGASLASTAPQLLTLTVWLILAFAVALRLFRWR